MTKRTAAGPGRGEAPCWLEAILACIPTPLVLVEPGSARMLYANPAADELVGGRLPRATGIADYGAHFPCTYPDGRQVPAEEHPSVRAARGERLRALQMDWHVEGRTRSMLISSETLTLPDDGESYAIVCFEDVSRLRRLERHLAAILRDIGEGVYTVDGEGNLTGINGTGARMLGYRREELIGQNMHDRIHHVHADGSPYPLRDCPLVATTRSGQLVHVDDEVFVRADGTRMPVSYTSSPLTGTDGRLEGAVIVFRDITAQRQAAQEHQALLTAEQRARQRAGFLAEAGRLLHESLDFAQTLRHLSELVVPERADWCAVDLAAGGRRPRMQRVAIAHQDPDRLRLAEELFRRYPPQRSDPAWEVLRTGATLHLPHIDDGLLAGVAQDAEHLRLLRELSLHAAVIVPIATGSTVLGTLTLVHSARKAGWEPEEVEMFEELGRRAGLAIDHARLYQQRDHIARTLQAGLFPHAIPSVPGAKLAARFLAAGEGIEVGGDFYDVFFPDRDGWAVVLGDVCGKGPAAAALTALMRHTVRIAARYERTPGDTLAALNRAILDERLDGRFCTAVLAFLQPCGGQLSVRLASGGHPLPILAHPDGRARTIGGGGMLLGVRSDASYAVAETTLSPGDCLILYTDGLTEAGAPERVLIPEEVARLAGEAASGGAEAVASHLEAAARSLTDGELRDDLALVVIEASGA